MSLNGKVWAPIGPSPIARARSPQRPGHRYRGQPEQRQHHLHRHEPGRVVDARATKARPGHRSSTGRRARHRRAGRDRDRSGRPSIIYVGTGDPNGSQFWGERRSRRPGCPSRPTAARAGYASARDTHRALRATRTSSSTRKSTSSSSIRPTASRLPRVRSRRLRLLRWRVKLDAGARPPLGDVRSLVLDRTSPAAARILFAGVTARSVPVQRRRAELGTDPRRCHHGSLRRTLAARQESSASSARFVVALAPPTSPPNPAASRCSTPRWSGQGRASSARPIPWAFS